MARTPGKSIVTAAVAALSLSGMATAAESNSLRGIDLRAYEQTIARDDRDAGPPFRAIAVCEMRFRTKELANPGAACGVAYEYATREKKYEQALRYAALGCEKHKSVESCRNVGALPLWMGNQGITVPVSFKAELKRVAEFVCYSGARIKAMNGVDITGRECGYLARRFNLAKDPEYAFALEPAARRFFEAIYEPSLSGKLYMAACERLGSADSCDQARTLGLKVDKVVARSKAKG